MGSTTFRAGARLRSQVCETQVIVVRAGTGAHDLGCGGQPLIDLGAQPEAGLASDPTLMGGSPLGKRFTLVGDDPIELLVTHAGDGTLTADGKPLVLKEAAQLPSSD
jgi:hypothetical protein